MTWHTLKPALPYHQDKDYRDSFVQAIKVAVGLDTPVDITVFESWGSVQVDLNDEAQVRILSQHPMVSGEGCRYQVDRGMQVGTRTIV